jgi:hypothetical protein
MRSPKLRTVGFLFILAASMALMALVYFPLYLLLTTITSRTGAGIFILACIALAAPAVAYGLYGAIRIQFYGETYERWMDSVAALIPQNPRVWLCLVFPLVIPVFASIYSLALTLLFLLILWPFGGYGNQVAAPASWVILGLSILFALGTAVWIWRQSKMD